MEKKQTGEHGAIIADVDEFFVGGCKSLREAIEAMEALEAVAVDEKVTYAIMYDGEFLLTTTEYVAKQGRGMTGGLTKLIIDLSGVYPGAFYLLSVEKSEDKGWVDYNLVAVARDGGEL